MDGCRGIDHGVTCSVLFLDRLLDDNNFTHVTTAYLKRFPTSITKL